MPSDDGTAAALARISTHILDTVTGEPAREVQGPLRAARRLGIDRGKQLLHRPRRRRAERLVEMDCFVQLLADQFELAGKLVVAGERLLHALGIMPIEGAGRMPGQKGREVLALFVDRVHGQPLSIPSASSSSASRLRA